MYDKKNRKHNCIFLFFFVVRVSSFFKMENCMCIKKFHYIRLYWVELLNHWSPLVITFPIMVCGEHIKLFFVSFLSLYLLISLFYLLLLYQNNHSLPLLPLSLIFFAFLFLPFLLNSSPFPFLPSFSQLINR